VGRCRIEDMKSDDYELIRSIKKRRIDIANIILKVLLIPGIISLFTYLYALIIISKIVSILDIAVLFFIFIYILIISVLIVYFRKIDIKIIYLIISTILFTSIVYLALRNGTLVNILYLLSTLLIILNSYIFEYKKQYFVYFVFISLVVILFLQNLNLIQFEPIALNSDPLNTLVSISFLYLIYRISNIGFNQIEYSFNKAILYSKKLEKLNMNLDRLVIERTTQLNSSLEIQRESLHQLIIAGKVARPIFHDLKSPLTVIKGNTELMMYKNILSNNEIQMYFNTINLAELQIERILNSAKELMNSKLNKEEFYIRNVVDSVIEVIKSETNRNSIKIQNRVNSSTKIFGVMSSFERIIINLILNSIQSFVKKRGKNKCIKIYEQNDNKKLYIIIEDNGNGIDSTEIGNVFNYGYTTNSTVDNVGLGLDFVKSIMHEQFNGSVELDSIVNRYTKIVLAFPSISTNPSSPNPSI
jgi:signal transduction histidine kinase